MKLVIARSPRLNIHLAVKEAGISYSFGDIVMRKPRPPRAIAFVIALSVSALAADTDRVQLTFDTKEADQVLAILELRAAGKPVDDAQWQKLFATEPYQRLKVREKKIAERFNDTRAVLTDEEFRKFVLSDSLLARGPKLRSTLERWKEADLRHAAERVLQYLPASAVIRAKVFPVIKPKSNSFVWETSTDPTIFLYLDPEVGVPKFSNTVAHELHHIGLASAQADFDARIKALPQRAAAAAGWMGAFGEGLAMLAAAGGPDVDPHAASTPEEHARWDRDMANFDHDLRAVNAFFLDIVNGKFANDDALTEKGSSFFGAQGPWYTVGYKMAVMVEKRFGRDALIGTMLDPRRLLLLYNQAASEQNARRKEPLPLWSEEILKEVQVGPRGS
jgi:putative zinc-dependent peptidase DUF5700